MRFKNEYKSGDKMLIKNGMIVKMIITPPTISDVASLRQLLSVSETRRMIILYTI